MDSSYLAKAQARIDTKIERTETCWLWTGAMMLSGYGTMYFDGRVVGAHRVAWMIANGQPIPEGGVVAHRCDVKRCVNPAHLFLTDQAGNVADMQAKHRGASGPKLAAAISAGWTAEARQRASATRFALLRERREEAASAAGVPIDWKRCARCETWKGLGHFVPNPARFDGVSSYCRPCERKRLAEYQRRRRAALRG